ncbi:hypothetical protein HanPI659440_Chr13g0498471 [Helianthus annuus]|nr:hypothetical protein HanPI659440_Chr13g0498471 [Helianthus annuus]
MWALTRAHWEQERLEGAQEVSQRRAWEQEQECLRVVREALEDRRWATTAIGQQIHINNTKYLHDQERHRRNYMVGLPYQPHTPSTNYADLLVPRGPSDPSPHWPEGVGSSYIPPHLHPPVEGERGPRDDYREMMETLTGYPYSPYPSVDPNEQYQR